MIMSRFMSRFSSVISALLGLSASNPLSLSLVAAPPVSLTPVSLPKRVALEPQPTRKALSVSDLEQLDRAAVRRAKRALRLEAQAIADDRNRQRLRVQTIRLQ